MEQSESHQRSLAKALSWRILGSLATMVLVFIYTGQFKLSVEVGVAEFIGKIALFYIHERIWMKLR